MNIERKFLLLQKEIIAVMEVVAENSKNIKLLTDISAAQNAKMGHLRKAIGALLGEGSRHGSTKN